MISHKDIESQRKLSTNKLLKIFITSILLIVFLNSCGPCGEFTLMTVDPVIFYALVEPPLDKVDREFGPGYEDIYRSDSLNILISLDDLGIHLEMTTALGSVIIRPDFSYIRSPYDSNKVIIPYRVENKYFSNDSLISYMVYEIGNLEKGKSSVLASINVWDENSIAVYDFCKHEEINKAELLRPYYLHNHDSLSVYFKFRKFLIFEENSRVPIDKSDFLFCYDVYNKKDPLIFHFSIGYSCGQYFMTPLGKFPIKIIDGR